MNLTEALAHVAEHRANGTLAQLDRQLSFRPEAVRDERAANLWAAITESIDTLADDAEMGNANSVYDTASNIQLDVAAWARYARCYPEMHPDAIWAGVRWRDAA